MLFFKQTLPYAIVCSTLLIGACSSSSGDSTSEKADTTPPTFDGVMQATASGGTNIQVAWNAASDDSTAVGNISYHIYASLDDTNKGQARDTVTGVTNHTLKYLEPGNTYFITVEAADEAGNSNSNNAQLSETTAAVVSLELDIQPTLEAACATSGCHDAASQSHDVDLSSAAITHTNLVGAAMHHCGGTGALRVSSSGGATAVGESKLLDILEWDSATPCLDNISNMPLQMPPDGRPQLDQEFIHILEHWIDDGAPNN